MLALALQRPADRVNQELDAHTHAGPEDLDETTNIAGFSLSTGPVSVSHTL